MMNMHSGLYGIPAVDLADFMSNDEERRGNFVRDLGEAYENIGFVAVKNHFVDKELQSELYQQTEAFFNLTVDVKLQYEVVSNAGQRGYTSFGRERAKGATTGDLKEFWHFGQLTADPSSDVYPPNIMVDQLPQFNDVGRKAFSKLEETGRIILRAIALHLGLNEYYFDEKIKNGNSILRPIHYPPITSEPKYAVRAERHEDINLITLLIGASSEGLEVLKNDGEWVAVTALPEHIVVNVGDMLQRLTNGKLKSTTHRVVNPPREKWGRSRYSIPFFLHPTPDTRLDCLPSCVEEEEEPKYEPISASEYLNERLREIGLKTT